MHVFVIETDDYPGESDILGVCTSIETGIKLIEKWAGSEYTFKWAPPERDYENRLLRCELSRLDGAPIHLTNCFHFRGFVIDG